MLGPSFDGFVGMAAESYETFVDVKAYNISLSGWKLVDEKHYKNAALEFGGDYIC